MNAKTTRLLKEARPLFWPWFALIIAGALPLVHAPQSVDLIVAGMLLGFSLLAALPFGNEFQNRTLALLLAQPVDRMEIWSEKLGVMAVATLSAALVLILGWRVSALQVDPHDAAFLAAWIIATTASATYWTLLARSTLGGLALNVAVNGLVVEMPWLVFYHERALTIPLSPSTITISAVTFMLFCYAGVMLWLGAQKLARFQAIGGMAGDDLLMAGPSVMPEAFARWFRSRPTGAFLNLIRKEFRLLRPVWLITLMSVLGWTCLTMSGLVPEYGFGRLIVSRPGSPTFLLFFAQSLVAALSIAIAILAGCLSRGEERTSGTHAWHMTLPVSARVQWLIKLVMAMITGFVCGGLLPLLVLIAGGFLFGSPLMFVDPHGALIWLAAIPLLTLASFWCACAFNGTVRAVLWLFPMLGALAVSGQLGGSVAPGLMDFIFSRLNLFSNFRFTNAVSNVQFIDMGAIEHLGQIDSHLVVSNVLSNEASASFMLVPVLFLVPILLFAIIQSFRLFRAQVQEGTLSVIRKLAPMAAMVFLCVFSLVALVTLVDRARRQMWTMFHETQEAIVKIQAGTANLDAAQPLQLTMEDLAKASPLSERTRRWLRNSRISVGPNRGKFIPCCSSNSGRVPFFSERIYTGFLATVHLTGGSECTLILGVGLNHRMGYLSGVCK